MKFAASYLPTKLLLEMGLKMRMIDEKCGRFLVLAWEKQLWQKVRQIDEIYCNIRALILQ